MIVLRIHGGLGNQMFQYAFGQELKRRGRTVRYDTSSYQTDSLRSYELDVWRVKAPAATAEDLRRMPRRYGGDGWRRWLRGDRPLRKVSERPAGFRREFLTPPDHTYLDGYWQSERFFPTVAAEVREAFQPATNVSRESAEVARRIERTDAIAVHVRRGDYLQHAFTQVCDLDYYRRCVADLLARRQGLEAFVFSDDSRWCQQNLRFGCPTHYVDHNRGPTAYEDLWLMSRCRRHVIANSSFSWWGAWLKEDPTGEVYAPRPWFLDESIANADICPERWRVTPTEAASRRAA